MELSEFNVSFRFIFNRVFLFVRFCGLNQSRPVGDDLSTSLPVSNRIAPTRYTAQCPKYSGIEIVIYP